MVSEIEGLSKSLSSILNNDVEDNESLPELIPVMSNSASDNEEEAIHWTSSTRVYFGVAVICPILIDSYEGDKILSQ